MRKNAGFLERFNSQLDSIRDLLVKYCVSEVTMESTSLCLRVTSKLKLVSLLNYEAQDTKLYE